MKAEDLLSAIPVVSLRQHDLLCNKFALFHCTEANDISDTRICVLASMRNTHSSPDSNVEAGQIPVAVYDGNKSEVVGKDIDIVGRRNGHSDLELSIL